MENNQASKGRFVEENSNLILCGAIIALLIGLVVAITIDYHGQLKNLGEQLELARVKNNQDNFWPTRTQENLRMDGEYYRDGNSIWVLSNGQEFMPIADEDGKLVEVKRVKDGP